MPSRFSLGWSCTICWLVNVVRISSSKDICSQTDVSASIGNGDLLTSPNYPQEYPNNLMCYLNIDTGSDDLCITVEINYLDMEELCNYDSLSIYDGSELLEKLCGYQTEVKTFLFSTSRITLLFETDGSLSYKGFELTYAAVPCQGSECMHVF
jgi:hypothetical protein